MNPARHLFACILICSLPSLIWAKFTDGLVLHYKLDDTEGPVIDSADAHDGINNGAMRGVSGINGYAFQFDGDDYVDTTYGNDVEYPNGITISAWVLSSEDGNSGLVTARGPGDGASSLFLGLNAGHINPGTPEEVRGVPGMNVCLGDSSACYNRTAGNTKSINDGQWHHVVGSYGGSTLSVYVDGAATSEPFILPEGVITKAMDNFLLGYDDFTPFEEGRWLEGKIDDVRIWERALSSREIDYLYAPVSLNNGLIAHYKLDDTEGPVIDSADAHDGINNGAVRGVPGINGHAFMFDGDDYVDTTYGNDVEYPNGITISAWVLSSEDGNSGLVTARGPGDGASSWFLGLNAGHINPGTPEEVRGVPTMNVCLGDSSACYGTAGNTKSINDGQWHHVVGSYDGSTLSVYVDGDGTSEPFILPEGVITKAMDNFLLGYDDFTPFEEGRWLEGKIDDVRIWERALKPGEIDYLYDIPLLHGDYNRDGSVDAADYVTWRKTDGTRDGYNSWRANFGRTVGNGAISNATAPEPATAILFVLGASIGCWRTTATYLVRFKTR